MEGGRKRHMEGRREQYRIGRSFCLKLGLCFFIIFAGCGITEQDMPMDFVHTVEKSESGNENTESSSGEKTESEKRLLSFYDNMIVGEKDGEIVLLGAVEGLKEENDEIVTGVISYKEDILYVIQGYADGKNYAGIYSLKSGDLIIKKEDCYAAEWKVSGEDLFIVFPYYNKEGRTALRYYFYLLSQKEDGSYAVEPAYEELESSVYADSLCLVSPVCIHEDLQRDGMTYAWKDIKGKKFYGLDSKGKMLKILRTEHQVEYTELRTDGGILFDSVFGGDEAPSYDAIMYYDTKTGEEMCLYDSREDKSRPGFMASEGDIIYYYEEDETEFEHSVYRIYSYNLKTMGERLLYTAEEVPGYKNGRGWPGVTGFAVSEGKCLFIKHDKYGTGWYRMDTGSDAAPESTGITVYDDTPLKYGDVSYESATIVSETTGEDVYRYYVEKLQLTTEDAGTEAINGTLEEIFESERDIAKGQAETASELAEDDSLWMCNTYMNSVNAIREIGTRYYAIDFYGYEYWGGVHGLPFYSFYLFDRSTGKNLTIRDIYGGTEEEFKAVVARYTVEDWQKNPDEYYGWEDEEEAYDSLYADTSFDVSIKYGEQKVIITCYPYTYGSYASGFIEVEIPYEELGLEEMLE